MDSDTIYDPQEDSYLLEESSKKYSRGLVLDMGTGSGIQGIAALSRKEVSEVVFVDVNPKALEQLKERFSRKDVSDNGKKISFVRSDLFSKIPRKQRFDTIIFNPPYLPLDEFDDEKLITTAGKEGNEIILKFLEDAKKYLAMDGQILLLFSSLSGKGAVDAKIRDLGFDKNMLSKKGLFMEQLYVYQLKTHDENIIKGHRGIVEIKTLKIKGKEVKVAIKRSLTQHYDANGEAKFLKILNKRGIGPKLLKLDDKKKSIMMEFIDGQRILEYFDDDKTTKKDVIEVMTKVLDQLLIMDGLGINKLEMTNPYKHIIIYISDKGINPVMIDFERCIYTEKPKNITQFIQFLCSGNLRHILKKKNIEIDTDKLFDIAKGYKKDMKDKYIREILRCIK